MESSPHTAHLLMTLVETGRGMEAQLRERMAQMFVMNLTQQASL
jgi:hypothetical protein